MEIEPASVYPVGITHPKEGENRGCAPVDPVDGGVVAGPAPGTNVVGVDDRSGTAENGGWSGGADAGGCHDRSGANYKVTRYSSLPIICCLPAADHVEQPFQGFGSSSHVLGNDKLRFGVVFNKQNIQMKCPLTDTKRVLARPSQ